MSISKILNLMMIDMYRVDGLSVLKIINLISKCLDYFIINEIINSTTKIKTIIYKCTIIPTQYISFIYRSSLVLITLVVGIVFNVPNVLGIHLMFCVIVKMQ